MNAIVEVFEFSSQPFTDVLHRLRLDVFETAARTGTDVIFTNNSMWSGQPTGDAFVTFARHAEQIVRDAGGATTFVRLTAPVDVLCTRVGSDDRRAMGKIVDADRLRRRLAEHDEPAVHDDDLTIDTAVTSPVDAARRIADVLN